MYFLRGEKKHMINTKNEEENIEWSAYVTESEKKGKVKRKREEENISPIQMIQKRANGLFKK